MAVRRLAEHQPEDFSFSPENRAWAERQIAKFPAGRQASAVIPLLWRAQEQEGWVTKPAIEGVAAMLDMPTIRVLEVATFYTMFHLEPVGSKAHVQVCGTTPCMLRGAGEHHLHLPQPHPRASAPPLGRRRLLLGGGRVPRRLRERADGADLQGHLRGSDAGEFSRRCSMLSSAASGRGPARRTAGSSPMPVTGLTSLTDIAYAEDESPGR